MSNQKEQVAVAKALSKAFWSSSVTERDLTKAEEEIKGIAFDYYRERVSCKLMTGIKEEHFETVIEKVAKIHQIPEEKKNELLLSTYCDDVCHSIVKDFQFRLKEESSFVYGRLVTKRDECNPKKMSVAYSIVRIEFKFSLRQIEHTKTTKFLWFIEYSQVWHDTKERNMTEGDKEKLQLYFQKKVAQGFQREFPGLLAVEA